MTTTARRRSSTVAVLGLAALLTLAGCSGASGSDESSDAEAPAAGSAREPADSGADAAEDTGAGDSGADDAGNEGQTTSGSSGSVAVPALQAERSIIATAVVSLRDDDASQVRAEVMQIVDVHRGQVSDEETTTDDDGEVSMSRLVLRIPVSDFTEAVDALEKVGELVSSNKSSDDVSFDVIDVRARIRAQEQSLRRVEVLLERAESIRDIVSIESELTRRQSELEALKSKQAYLGDQTSYSTITVYVERTGEPTAKKTEKPDEEELGFLAGLEGGLKALKAFATVMALLLGALLPWLVVGGVLGVPAWLLYRRAARRRPAPSLPE